MTGRLSMPHASVPVGSADVLPRLAATVRPHRAALRAGAKTVTFAELDRDVSRLAFGLRQLIGGDGLPVVVSAVLGLEFPTAFFAVPRSGNVVVPANPRMPVESFARLLDATRARAVVLSRAMYERVRPVLAYSLCAGGIEQVVLLDAPSWHTQLTCAELATRGGLLVEPRDRDENEPAAVVDGGRVLLSHHALKAGAVAAAVAGGLTDGSVALNATPAYHPAHLTSGVLAGATQLLFGSPDPAAAAREAVRGGATHECRADGSTVHIRPDTEAVAS